MTFDEVVQALGSGAESVAKTRQLTGADGSVALDQAVQIGLHLFHALLELTLGFMMFEQVYLAVYFDALLHRCIGGKAVLHIN